MKSQPIRCRAKIVYDTWLFLLAAEHTYVCVEYMFREIPVCIHMYILFVGGYFLSYINHLCYVVQNSVSI